MTETEKSLFDACEYARIAHLTEPWDGKSVYIQGIAKTLKADGNNYYCIVEIDEEGKNRIVKDFGRCSAILRFEEIYPLSYLKPSYIKKFPKTEEGTANLTEYLVENGFTEAANADNRKDLDKLNIRLAIKRQLADEKRANKIIIKD